MHTALIKYAALRFMASGNTLNLLKGYIKLSTMQVISILVFESVISVPSMLMMTPYRQGLRSFFLNSQHITVKIVTYSYLNLGSTCAVLETSGVKVTYDFQFIQNYL